MFLNELILYAFSIFINIEYLTLGQYTFIQDLSFLLSIVISLYLLYILVTLPIWINKKLMPLVRSRRF